MHKIEDYIKNIYYIKKICNRTIFFRLYLKEKYLTLKKVALKLQFTIHYRKTKNNNNNKIKRKITNYFKNDGYKFRVFVFKN